MEKRIRTLDPLAVGGRGRRVGKQATNELLLEVLDPFTDEFHRHGVILDFKGDQDAHVKTNREVAQQALANLVENAVWFAAQGDATTPSVSVEVHANGFRVSDNGPGIDPSIVDSVFEPHFTTRDEAHGLGLTLVRDLLTTVGGRVRLTKNQPATFDVTFE